MEHFFNKRRFTGIFCAGMLLCATPSMMAQEKQTQKTFTKKEIDQTIADIQKSIKGLRIIKYIATGAAVGLGGVAIAGSIAAAIVIALALPKRLATWRQPGMSNKAIGLTFGVVAAIASGLITTQTVLALFGGLSASIIISAFMGAQQLEMIESTKPGTLNPSQKKALAEFNAIAQGPIIEGIISGIRIKNVYESQAEAALKQHPSLLKSFKNKNEANKTIIYYIKNRIKAENMQEALDDFNEKIKEQKEKRDQHSKWLPEYHIENAKLLAMQLDIKLGFIKMSLQKTNKNIKKLNRMYPKMEDALEDIISTTKTKIKDLLNPEERLKKEGFAQ